MWTRPDREGHGGTLAVALAVCLFAVCAPTPAIGQFRYRRVNALDLARRARIIVQGRVLATRSEAHPDYPHVPTLLVTLEVEQMLRGPTGERFSFRELALFPRSSSGKRSYAAGERLLLFMPAPSAYGLSSPLAREQGRFHIFRDASGTDQVANEFNNAGLFRSVAETASQSGLHLSSHQLRLTSVERGPVPLAEFVSLVKALATLPRSE